MNKDDLVCWIIAIERRMSRFRFETPGWEFHCEWWGDLCHAFDQIPWKPL